MSEVYVIIVCDRHMDVFTEIHAQKDRAIARAWELAREFSADDDDPTEEKYEGWEIYIGYGVEGDCIYVAKEKVNR